MRLSAVWQRSSGLRRVRVSLSVLIVVTLTASAVAGSMPASAGSDGNVRARPVRIMTRNLYLGADAANVVTATTLGELAEITTRNFEMVQATDFAERAIALAAEIDDADPDLVGLQEVALYRRGELGVLDGPATPATIVVQDWLQLLLDALAGRGRFYDVAVVQEQLDAETPSTLGFDVRLTQRDVILVKQSPEIAFGNALSAHFSVNLTFPTVAGDVTVLRGWTSVDATVNRQALRFVNTHLEAYSPWHRQMQASELVAEIGTDAIPIVVAGDLNTTSAPDPADAFSTFVANGFVAATTPATWDPPTCCYSEDLTGGVLTEAIDHVLTRPAAHVASARITGTDVDGRTNSGLWPSDHAGLVIALTF
jgi:endonuclease/exonuclease/phosphatase family metal-dependent hydrolase